MTLERHALAATAVAVITVAFCPSARAQAGDPAAADALFRRGREELERGNWASACPKFAESQRLNPAPGTLLNLADCEDHTGRLASAYEHYKSAIETMAPNDDRVPFAKQHMASIEKSVPHLTLNVGPGFPERAQIRRDDVELRNASLGLALPVDPGTHTILVTAPGHAERRVVVALKVGDSQTVVLDAGPVVESKPATPAEGESKSTPPRAAPSDSSGVRRTAGVVLGAVGLAGIGVGAVAGALVLGKKSIVNDPNHCDPITHTCDQAGVNAASDGRALSVTSTVGFVAGAALAAAGAVLFFTATGGAQGGARGSAFLAPEIYPGGAGMGLGGSF